MRQQENWTPDTCWFIKKYNNFFRLRFHLLEMNTEVFIGFASNPINIG